MTTIEANAIVLEILQNMVSASLPLEINSDMISVESGSPDRLLTEITNARRQCRMFGINIECTAGWGFARAMIEFGVVDPGDAFAAIFAFRKSQEA